MFVVSVEYKVDLSEVDKVVPEHIEFLDKYYDNGHFLFSGRKVPRTGGVILAKANSKEELDAILSEDPFYQKNLANYEVTEFVPNKFAAGFEVLL